MNIRQLKIHDERDDDDVYGPCENRNEDVIFQWVHDDNDDNLNLTTLCGNWTFERVGIRDMDFFFRTFFEWCIKPFQQRIFIFF